MYELYPMKILNVTAGLTDPKYIKVKQVLAERQLPDGETESVYWECVSSHDSVHVLLIDLDNREFILVKQVRIPVLLSDPKSDGIIIEACAGLVDKKKTLTTITKEEILEECGYEISEQDIHYVRTFKKSVGMSGGNAFTYIAYVSDSVRATKGGGIHGENIIPIRVKFDKALPLVYGGKAMDTTTAFLLMFGHNLIKGLGL